MSRPPSPVSFTAGKYDKALRRARKESGATSAMLIVMDGERGPGCSFQVAPNFARLFAAVMQDFATQLAKDVPLIEAVASMQQALASATTKDEPVEPMLAMAAKAAPGKTSVAIRRGKGEIELLFSASVTNITMPDDNARMVAEAMLKMMEEP